VRVRPCFRASGRRTVSGVELEQALEGKKPRRAPTRRSHPGQGRGVASTDLTGGARLRSGRAGRQRASPACMRSDGRSRRALRRVRRTASAVARNRRHGPTVRRAREGEPRQRVGAAGKAVVKPSSTSRQAAVEREPAWKQWPARAGTALREGTSSEGRLQERERHGTRPRSSGAPGTLRTPHRVRRSWRS